MARAAKRKGRRGKRVATIAAAAEPVFEESRSEGPAGKARISVTCTHQGYTHRVRRLVGKGEDERVLVLELREQARLACEQSAAAARLA